jgi:hypothetical protein
MDNQITYDFAEIMIFFTIWYLFTITTYGTNVPAGLFLPGMIIGCTLGDIYSEIMKNTHLVDSTDATWISIRKKYIVIGCGSFMAGYTRMTYSLGVILMETSQDLSVFVPIIFSIIVSNQVGFKFTRSLYQRATRGKQMPIISDKIPGPCKKLRAGDVMAKPVITVRSVEKMDNIKKILKTEHHAFPVINMNDQLVGIIPRNFIMTIIEYEAWYSTTEVNEMARTSSMISSVEVVMNQNEFIKSKLRAKNKYINTHMFNPSISSQYKKIAEEKIKDYPPIHESRILPW